MVRSSPVHVGGTCQESYKDKVYECGIKKLGSIKLARVMMNSFIDTACD